MPFHVELKGSAAGRRRFCRGCDGEGMDGAGERAERDANQSEDRGFFGRYSRFWGELARYTRSRSGIFAGL